LTLHELSQSMRRMRDQVSPIKPPETNAKASAKAARLAREAAALRANLRKRKDRAREQAAADGPPQQESTVSDPARKRMTSDEFIAWAMEQDGRCELVAGEIVAMAPERSAHALTKFHIARRLAEAIETAGLPCQVYPDGMAIEIDDATTYEPDASVRCGEPLPPDALTLHDPIIVVEVLSPSSLAADTGAKLADYFRLPSVRHYLIVRTEDRTIIHHARGDHGAIATRILRDSPIVLEPPGITLTDCFPPSR
jgi:Uma2 family endonuclease